MTRVRAAAAVLVSVVACARGDEGPPPGKAIAIRDARVFDGLRVLPRATVLVRGDRIEAVGADVDVPDGAEVIEAAGKTLLPGLIDSHTHRHDREAALEQALALGVTTEIGMMEDPAVARAAASGAAPRAALHSAGWSLTVEGGLGSEEGPMPLLAPGDDLSAFVAARRAEGSAFIEVMVDRGTAWGIPHAAVEEDQIAAAVTAAHRAGAVIVADLSSHREARRAIAAGVDGLGHLYVEGPDPDLARQIAESHAFVIATMPVLFSICSGTRGAALAADPAIAPYLMPGSEQALRESYALFSPGIACESIRAAARELLRAGVPILAGSDAGSPGTTHGASIHDGLAILVEAGFSPVEALAAATSAPARAFRLGPVGRIAAGQRADLLLVDGDPTRDIRATRAIIAVWKGGVPVDRARHRTAAEAARASFRVPAMAASVLGRFEDDSGDGWQARSDLARGGASRSEILLSDRTGGGSALQVSGQIAPGDPAWGGAVRFLAADPPAPVDLGSLQELRFALRGDGRRVRVLLFTLGGGPVPVELASAPTGARWSEHRVALAGRAELGDVVAILFSGSSAPGPFRFEIDDVELR